MRGLRVAVLAAGAALALALAPTAAADPDEAFAEQLHTFGIYGQKDYNAWIGKIMCKRLRNGHDPDAFASAKFVHDQLQKGSTTDQAWQFVGAGIPIYCPDQTFVLQRAAESRN
ncbi:DUF732 domain-containing protein [Mycolicibacterium tokaiense]|uniref:Protein of uncharacterized function (DUF732) n=1 Tax=Mycolicibacterium tokaiense TaxID=39695 RepID=A0A378TEV5_9MYCO|nr:DUF732 domain-containing protein [Mycolicibacterium tokaiense]BBY86448.1 hypothetical protein MTOK_22300 [Mycolicibacterium tokaiense]STZ59044.1 Protein of uncharacterised function (DUF732) [Mycolicibacterium tokaiense]